MAEENPQRPTFDPIVFDKPQLDAFVRNFAAEGQNPSFIIAREIAAEVSKDAPDFFTYQTLRDGTAKLFDFNEATKDLAPNKRALTDNQIINLLTVDTEGNPIEAGTFFEGFQREAAPQAGAFAGFIAGAKAGAKVPVQHPAAKLASIIVGGVSGLVGGYEGGELLTDALIGPEAPLLPGQRAAYEQGKTAAGVLAFLPTPFAISKNASLGTANYLANLQKQVYGPIKPSRSVRVSQFIERLANKSRASAFGKPVPFLITEGAIGAGAVGGAGLAERDFPDNPFARLMFEFGGGLIGQGVTQPTLAVAEGILNVKSIFKDIKNRYDTGGISNVLSPIKVARQRQAVDRILEILEAEGEDVQAVIDKLAGDDLSSLLVDASGNPIKLTAGAKAGSPALLAIEASLDQMGSGLGKERAAAAKSSIEALKNVIRAMALTGDPDALQSAADLAEAAFSGGFSQRLQSANEKVLNAFQSVMRGEELMRGGVDPETNMRLSEKLYDIFNNQLGLARGKEKKLWQAVPEVDITQFTDQNGTVSNIPNFIRAWNDLIGSTDEYRDEFIAAMPRLNQFVQRKAKELGLEGADDGASDALEKARAAFSQAESEISGNNQGVVFADILQEYSDDTMKSFGEDALSQSELAEALRERAQLEAGEGFNRPGVIKALNARADLIDAELAARGVDGPVVNVVTSTELTEMRSLALELGKKFGSGTAPETNKSRVAFAMADAMLRDLEYAPGDGDWRLAYDMARAYSRSLNDTFTRSIVGDTLSSNRQGGDRFAPELLSKRLLQGGNDPTYLRIEQINEIGNFGVNEGLQNAETTVGTLRGVTEQILRNARASVFDSKTGEVDPDKLREYIDANEDLLNQFPALKRDLQSSETANILLKTETEAYKKAQNELKNQLSFYDLMNPLTDSKTGRIFGTESPTSAIARALSPSNKTPIRDLNSLLEVAKNAPQDQKQAAMNGLKSTIFEWAGTKAGLTHSGTFSPSTLYNAMFRPIKGSQNRIPLSKWMLDNKVANEAEISNMKTYLTEMVKFEAAESAGEIGELVERAGPIMDFYLGITGSAIGTRAQSVLTGGQPGPGAIMAAGKGAETMRRIFADIPATQHIDVMSELMRNPELLAAMMRNPRGDKERSRLAQRVGDLLLQLGFIGPARRGVPSIVRETEEAIEAEPIPTFEDEEASLNIPARVPTPNVGPAPSPVIQTASASLPQTTPQSGPVNRARYAAMFPNDSASALIRQGIGSMMG